MNSTHTRKRTAQLKLEAGNKVKITMSKSLRREMRALWLFKSRTTDLQHLGDYYEQAFREYLEENKIPKLVPRITRSTTRLQVSEETLQMLDALRRIAIKRQQPLCVVIEEALTKYLTKDENYLGKDFYEPVRQERVV